MYSAVKLGAQLVERAEVVGAHVEADHCEVHYRHESKTQLCTCRAIVNAAGPWVNQVLARVDPVQKPITVDFVQGTHIIVEGGLQSGIYYLEAPHDRRAVFAIPWQGKIMIGTTETLFKGTPEQVLPLREEQRYLLETANFYFPRLNKGLLDIQSSFAGLRVLPASNIQSPFRRRRDTLLLTNQEQQPRVLSIYGGKLTAYRATAEKVLKRLRPVLPIVKPIADTRTLHLKPV
jgi:glycerol-3-phosphate dehydrogenase